MPALCLKAVSKPFSQLMRLPKYLTCVVVCTTSPFLNRTLGGNLRGSCSSVALLFWFG